jgi:CDGSH-type Zn-finger protein
MTDETQTPLSSGKTVIRIKPNGSAKVEGDFIVVDMDGNELAPGATKVSICRCGVSKKMPFCDGAHRDCGFQG